MRFNRRARLDTSQVSDRRGMGMGGLGAAGGGLGVIGLIIALLLGGNPLDGGGGGGTGFSTGAPASGGDLAQECRTGADAEQQADCRLVAVVNSVQEYWTETLQGYREAETTIFTGGVSSACGQASSAMGPFYCPRDQGVYLDLSFFQDLQTKFGAKGGDFAEAYVVAHEYGHHVQNLIGALDPGGVPVELQADCFAGAWARGAERTGFIVEISDDDFREGLDAAAAIGDDRIQERFQGRVDPHSFTHGSSEQRQDALRRGYREGPEACEF